MVMLSRRGTMSKLLASGGRNTTPASKCSRACLAVSHPPHRQSCSPAPFHSSSSYALACGAEGRRSLRQRLICRVGDADPDADPVAEALESLFLDVLCKKGKVHQEFQSVFDELINLSRMGSKFPDFDLAGKKLFLEKMEAVSQRFEVFIKRIELSSDPGAKEYLRSISAETPGGITLPMISQGVKLSVDDYRRWVAAEEKASADPATHQKFLQDFKVRWDQSEVGRTVRGSGNLSYIDDDTLVQAGKDPNFMHAQFFKALDEISDNPTDPQVVAKWIADPNIGPMAAQLWQQVMAQQEQP